MRVDIATREFPPHIYGGAGVHVAELVRVLQEHVDVRVRCFDGPRGDQGITGYSGLAELADANPALGTLGVDLAMARDMGGADVIHSHTWYANMAGHIGGLLHGVPHIATAHSLEPLRPWKAEQLGGGYALSSWAERTTFESAARVIAVSQGMRRDIERAYPQLDPEKLRVVHNGIDTQAWKRPSEAAIAAAAIKFGIDQTRPAVVFVGRITQQKGLPHLLEAARYLDPEVQLIVCAGAPDTPEMEARVRTAEAVLRQERTGIIWIEQMLAREELQAVLATGTVFACPSIYEPLGIVNLEAMAVELPVVASAVGGIPEVVMHEETGLLVPIGETDPITSEPTDPAGFAQDFAQSLMRVISSPQLSHGMSQAGRVRAINEFSWEKIAQETVAIYAEVIA